MSKKDIERFKKLISLLEIFDSDYRENKSFSPSRDANVYYIVDGDSDESIGRVLYFSMELRDGPILVYVDDSGHTNVVDCLQNLIDEFEEPNSLYLAKETEDSKEFEKIYAEFKHNFYGPYVEILKLRKRLKELGDV